MGKHPLKMSPFGRHSWLPVVIASLVTEVALSLGPAKSGVAFGASAPGPTFHRDIEPILAGQCVGCHQEGQPAPFALTTYAEVKRHAADIATVTLSRFMPPWLPVEGYGRFADERRLTAEQIAVIQRWVAGGAPEGDPMFELKRPIARGGWQLGEPDYVVEMAETFTLPADGRDIYRNFVIRNPAKEPHNIRAMELRPGSKVVHHAFIQVDETGRSRRQIHKQEGDSGFEGMTPLASGGSAGGHFLGWQPGRGATKSPEGLPWTLPAGCDLVLQMHMQPSGKPENLRPKIGFYFTEKSPTNTPFKMDLRSYAIDIPAGATNYEVQVVYKLPTDVTVVAALPHAHYLGKQLEGFAFLPDGKKEWLLKIDNWDFNWQSDYRFAKPVHLPEGSLLSMRYVYDNSTNNVRNPSSPPVRVRYGLSTTDEMGELWFQMLVDSESKFNRLQADYQRWIAKDVVTFNELMLRQNPTNAHAHVQLGKALYSLGQAKDALNHFRSALRIDRNEEDAHYNLGVLLLDLKQPKLAEGAFLQTIRINPRQFEALNNLGLALLQQQRLDEAELAFREALQVHPGDSNAKENLALVAKLRERSH